MAANPGDPPLPVKGLSPEPLRRSRSAGPDLPFDRSMRSRTAVRFRSGAPAVFSQAPLPHADAERAACRAADPFDDATHMLTVRYENREAARGDCAPRKAARRSSASRRLRRRIARAAEGAARAAATASPTSPSKVVSIINLASVAALENAVGAPVHPLRFRGNLYVEGWPAWHEFECSGRRSRSARRG